MSTAPHSVPRTAPPPLASPPRVSLRSLRWMRASVCESTAMLPWMLALACVPLGGCASTWDAPPSAARFSTLAPQRPRFTYAPPAAQPVIRAADVEVEVVETRSQLATALDQLPAFRLPVSGETVAVHPHRGLSDDLGTYLQGTLTGGSGILKVRYVLRMLSVTRFRDACRFDVAAEVHMIGERGEPLVGYELRNSMSVALPPHDGEELDALHRAITLDVLATTLADPKVQDEINRRLQATKVPGTLSL